MAGIAAGKEIQEEEPPPSQGRGVPKIFFPEPLNLGRLDKKTKANKSSIFLELEESVEFKIEKLRKVLLFTKE